MEVIGTVTGSIFGGSTDGTATNNHVEVQGIVNGNVYAAVVESEAGIANGNILSITGMVDGNAVVVRNSGQEGTANQLRLEGNATVTGMAAVVANENGNNGYLNKRTLVWVEGTTKVGTLEGFNEINVALTDANSEVPALTLTNSKTLNLQNVNVVIASGPSESSGQVFRLFAFDNAEGSLVINNSTSFNNWTSLFAEKEWVLDTRGLTASEDGTYTLPLNNLVLSDTGELAATNEAGDITHVLGKADLLPTSEAKTLSEAFLGTVAFVNQGAEFIADEGLQAINQAVQGTNAFTTFGAIHGGVSRYETGSHVKLRGTSLAAGAAGHVGSAVLARFVEAGWGNSDSHVNSARGDATHDYYGVGVAGRWNITQPVYAEGSLRIGVASTDFDGQYVQGSAHYESDAFYASAHLGAGYVMDLGRNALDLYGRYTLTYLDSDEADLGTSTGDRLAMSSTTAHAVRFGARLTGELTPTVSWKAGAAFEHVFNGDADARVMVAGMTAALDTPSLSGNTGIVELGLTMKPAAESPWSAAAGLKGYVGDRRGVAGNITVQYAF